MPTTCNLQYNLQYLVQIIIKCVREKWLACALIFSIKSCFAFIAKFSVTQGYTAFSENSRLLVAQISTCIPLFFTWLHFWAIISYKTFYFMPFSTSRKNFYTKLITFVVYINFLTNCNLKNYCDSIIVAFFAKNDIKIFLDIIA